MQRQTRRRSLSPASPVRTRSVSKEGGKKRAQSISKLTREIKVVVRKSMTNVVCTGETATSVSSPSITVTSNPVPIVSSISTVSSNNGVITGQTTNNPTERRTDQAASIGNSALDENSVCNSTTQSHGKSTTVTVNASNLSVSSSTTFALPRTSAVSTSSSVLSSITAILTSSVNTGRSGPVFSTPLIQPMAASAGQPLGVNPVRDVEWPEGSEGIRMMFNSLTEPQKQEVADCLQALKYMRQRLRTSYLMERLVNGTHDVC